jgi:MATE family multidrug resistance protein
MLTRIGTLTMITVDTMMLGHVGADELAFYAISQPAQMTAFTVGLGLMSGTLVLVAQARGAGREHEIGLVFRVALVFGLAIGFAAALLFSLGETLLTAFGQSGPIAAGGGRVLEVVAYGMPASMGHIVCAMFLEALSRPRINLIVVWGANLTKVALNLVLIFGWYSDLHLGAWGAQLALSIVRWLMFVALFAYIATNPALRRVRVLGQFRGAWPVVGRLLRLGLPSGVAQGLESTAFAALAMFAGILGASALAAYQIALNVNALCYMLASGLATATAVHVGIAVGQRDRSASVASGWSGLALWLAASFVLSALLWVYLAEVLGLYTGDALLLASAPPVMTALVFTVIPDGAQGVLMGALRGAGDVLWPTALHLVAFWVVTVPLAHHLAFARDLGAVGLMWGLVVGLSVATAFLGVRFHYLGRREAGA